MAKTKMKSFEAVQALNALNGIEGKSSISMSWALDDIKDVLEKNNKRFNEAKDKLLEKHGELQDSNLPGGQKKYIIPPGNLPEYYTEMENLAGTEITIEFKPIDFNVFQAEGLKVDVSLAKVLRHFIIKAEKKEKAKETPEKKTRKLTPQPEEA